jgi:hypothetical protein
MEREGREGKKQYRNEKKTSMEMCYNLNGKN